MSDFDPTPEQRAVIDFDFETHGRVVAGPGTGKSATVVATAQRQASGGSRIKLLTFTRAATAELAQKAGAEAAEVERPSTIHSFAIATLVRNPGATNIPMPLRLADDWEQANVIEPSLSGRIAIPRRRIQKLFRELAANWESLTEEATPAVPAEERRRFMQGWLEHRQVFGYTLLAELPYGMMRALDEHSDLVGIDYDLLVVDEYQDLNACDLRALRLLAARGVKLLAVGDDDQSIYSFRKAAPEGLRRFPLDYAGSAEFPLTVTHRFGSEIINWAAHVIEADPDRIGRPRIEASAIAPAGDVKLLRFDNARAEARGIAKLAGVFRAAGVDEGKILVLVRSDYNRAFSEPIREALEAQGFTVTDPDYAEDLMNRLGNRAALETVRLLVVPEDSISWASLLVLEDGIGSRFMDYVYAEAVRVGKTFGSTLLALAAESFPGGPSPSSSIAERLIDQVHAWLGEQGIDPTGSDSWPETIARLTDLPRGAFDDEALTLIRQVGDVVESGTTLSRFLGQIIPLGKDIATSLADGIRIMTMAGSKGLTVDATIIAGLEEGLIPRPERDRSEERRLLYVAMTRARRFVYGTWARRRAGPAARAGGAGLALRSPCSFLEGGPVTSIDGGSYLEGL